MQGSETSAATVPTTKVTNLVALVRAEYQELPGLCLTRAQVQRLWLLEPSACDIVLRALVDAGYLRLAAGGYIRK